MASIEPVGQSLDRAILPYVSEGFRVTSKTENMATLERNAATNPLIVIGLVLTFWIGAIIYGVGSSKKYRVTLSVDSTGQVFESGDNLKKFLDEKRRRDTSATVFIAIGVVLVCIYFAISASNR
jgi:hypothetical protein